MVKEFPTYTRWSFLRRKEVECRCRPAASGAASFLKIKGNLSGRDLKWPISIYWGQIPLFTSLRTQKIKIHHVPPRAISHVPPTPLSAVSQSARLHFPLMTVHVKFGWGSALLTRQPVGATGDFPWSSHLPISIFSSFFFYFPI